MSNSGEASASHSAADALGAVLPLLACPLCGSEVARFQGELRCALNHSFNIARQGYASLLSGGRRISPGDDADMVASRARFLARGHYAPIAEAVACVLPDDTADGLAVDIAGGTGYYLSRLLEVHPRLLGLSLDLSAFAARRAAKAHPRVAAATADAWTRFPLRDGSVRCVLSIFGPRNADETARVLAPGGDLVVVTPTERHLAELRSGLGLIGIDERKPDRLAAQLARFSRQSEHTVEYRAELTEDDVFDDVRMGPNAHHTDPAELRERIGGRGMTVTVSVVVSRYRIRAGADPSAAS